jgi:hypothetical protein
VASGASHLDRALVQLILAGSRNGEDRSLRPVVGDQDMGRLRSIVSRGGRWGRCEREAIPLCSFEEVSQGLQRAHPITDDLQDRQLSVDILE